jgi:hypothetical protein
MGVKKNAEFDADFESMTIFQKAHTNKCVLEFHFASIFVLFCTILSKCQNHCSLVCILCQRKLRTLEGDAQKMKQTTAHYKIHKLRIIVFLEI